jgi:hypothetical protein
MRCLLKLLSLSLAVIFNLVSANTYRVTLFNSICYKTAFPKNYKVSGTYLIYSRSLNYNPHDFVCFWFRRLGIWDRMEVRCHEHTLGIRSWDRSDFPHTRQEDSLTCCTLCHLGICISLPVYSGSGLQDRCRAARQLPSLWSLLVLLSWAHAL